MLTGAMVGTELCQQPLSVLPLSCLLYAFQYTHLHMFQCVDLSGVCGVEDPLFSCLTCKFKGRNNGILSTMMLMFHPFNFNLLVPSHLKWISFMQDTSGPCIFIQFDNLCLLLGVLRPIMLNVLIDMDSNIPSFCFVFIPFVSFFLLSLESTEYHFMIHFIYFIGL